MAWHQGWRPYVPVAQRRTQARRTVAALRKRGVDIQPVEIAGRKIASTFWGKAWCDHLESFGDFENRLPRGRTYVRNGSVCHLDIAAGKVTALVSGTEMYNVEIRIRALGGKTWKAVRKRCAGRIGSLLELLQGNLSDHVMEVVSDRKAGLFPRPREIEFDCDCPDWADMCKHVAAVCYGVGARLDAKPELLFRLREVDQHDLITADAESAVDAATKRSTSKRLASDDLGDVFGIDLDDEDPAERKTARALRRPSNRKKTAKRKTAKRKVAKKKAVRRKATPNKKAAPKKKAATGNGPPNPKVAEKKAGKKRAAGSKAAARRRTTSGMKVASRKAPTGKKATKRKVQKKKAVKREVSTNRRRAE